LFISQRGYWHPPLKFVSTSGIRDLDPDQGPQLRIHYTQNMSFAPLTILSTVIGQVVRGKKELAACAPGHVATAQALKMVYNTQKAPFVAGRMGGEGMSCVDANDTSGHHLRESHAILFSDLRKQISRAI
jgi:hypothetical protein